MTTHSAPSRPDHDWRSGNAPRKAEPARDLKPMIADFVARRASEPAAIEQRFLWVLDVALLVACRAASDLIATHVEAALEAGTRQGEIVEAIVEAALYAGMPAGEAGLTAAMAVFSRHDAGGFAA